MSEDQHDGQSIDQPTTGNQIDSSGTPKKLLDVVQQRGSKALSSKWVLMAMFVLPIVIALLTNNPTIRNLRDPDFARGLITFLISVAAIGIAFVLVYSAHDTNDTGFRRSREIFTGITAILGTIVGFYFGSTDQGLAELQIASAKFSDNQLITYVAGGSAPYQYVITSSNEDTSEIRDTTQDGWVVETIDNVDLNTKISLTVTDSQGEAISTKIDFPLNISSPEEPKSSTDLQSSEDGNTDTAPPSASSTPSE